MRLTAAEAHAACWILVGLDLAARTWRIQWLLRGLGHRVGFRDALVLNAFGDAACGLTPMRLGGEPARLAGMLRARVPATAAFVAIGLEVLASWPVILTAAAWLGWRHAPAWWATARPGLVASLRGAWPWVVAVAVASLALWLLVRRVAAPARRGIRRPVRRVMVYWRRMPWRILAATAPLTLASLIARVALLPVLALTLADPPPLGPAWLGSFALLYSQLVLPTPSGAGAVELGFLAGAAGRLGPSETVLLLAWRWYSSGVGILLGAGLALRLYGRGTWDALRLIFLPTSTSIGTNDDANRT